MTEATFSIKLLTDDEIDTASTDALRELCKRADLDAWSTHRTVTSVQLHSPVVSTPGVLSAIDKALSLIAKAYADDGWEPVIDTNYSSIDLRVWQDDSGLRSSLRYARRRELEKDGAESA